MDAYDFMMKNGKKDYITSNDPVIDGEELADKAITKARHQHTKNSKHIDEIGKDINKKGAKI